MEKIFACILSSPIISSSIANDLTKWNDEQLHEHKDDDDRSFEKKSVECRHRMKTWKEAEHQRAEEMVRQKVEEEAKRKVEVEAQRRAEVKAKLHTEEVVWVQSLVSGPSKDKQPKAAASGVAEVMEQAGGLAPCYGCLGAGVACKMKMAGGDKQSTWQRKQEEVMSPWAGKKKAQMQSLVVDEDEDGDKEYEEEAEDEEAEEECDTLDRRRAAEESGVQSEMMLGILEEIQGCLDPEYTPDKPEVGSEKEFEEEEVAEVAEEREALKGQSEEEAKVDESV
ncbi:hypothetical protein PAXRUDRAFT_16864 [Paxillus rubicundulus Ve08.2h10]|uniref:Uncharacterized protein n=1 Tax=Paxillus rubicundulus Ve08.2h10 TaxID=930991 RepID=A0A0D0D4E6_9AGAM|nr:hypothetical protein PAXRUDRAFT_16864 [Paxillus rubicundulus Ve08.2h10]